MTVPKRKTSPASRNDFNPQSLDAQLATIHAAVTGLSVRMDDGFSSTGQELSAIRTQVTATNGRVTSLEYFRDTSKAKLAGLAASAGVAGTVLWGLIKAKFVRGTD